MDVVGAAGQEGPYRMKRVVRSTVTRTKVLTFADVRRLQQKAPPIDWAAEAEMWRDEIRWFNP